eukprot:TRINITY_DN2037_c0_g1_i1.p1 TRINITY_DN2037_c0_g1~~TRINITY_DN2037_c0_g1_i1.p1  ORF type:complete len:355 (+),score=68.28 TRINITY_DN2037_c0_g1_i1:41-1066(+)
MATGLACSALSSSWKSPALLPSQPCSVHRKKCYNKKKAMLSENLVNCRQGGHEKAFQNVKANIAAIILLNSIANQGIAAVYSEVNNSCQIAVATENNVTISNPADMANGPQVMSGMSAKNFKPARYSGRWFEVASLKKGFAGQGQEDCHCTQGIYTYDPDNNAIQVDTFCVHGSPDGYLTGIRGKVQCLSETELEKRETEVERQEMIKEKCYLRFPTLPFIPKEPYDVIATDYENFALVSGAKDRSFVQIYSRTPNPGQEFIENFKEYLASIGFDPQQIKDTPQDCELMPASQLALMMSKPGMQAALTNQFPELSLERPVEINPFTSVLETFKKLLALYFK